MLNLRAWLPQARPGAFFGWWVVAGCFVMATAAWGLAFYGNGVYLAHMVRDLGWPIAQVSPALSVYFWVGAVFLITTGRFVDRIGPQRSASLGMLAMVLAILMMARVQALWHFYAALVCLSLGWSWMSGAAINTTLARWFDKRRGAAVSLALTGASMGGILVVPLMSASIEHFGFSQGLSTLALVLAVPVLAMVWFSFVREPGLLGQRVDGAEASGLAATPAPGPSGGTTRRQKDGLAQEVLTTSPLPARQTARPEAWTLASLLRNRAFLTNVLPFSFGLLMHQITLFSEKYPPAHAAWAVVMTTASALFGRLLAGWFVDRSPRRLIAALNFAVQVIGIVLLAFGQGLSALYIGCFFYGIAVGNMIAFPGLLIQREFPPEQFAHVTRWATAINQSVYALGPGLLGVLRETSGSYFSCLMLCAGIGLASSLVVWYGRPRHLA